MSVLTATPPGTQAAILRAVLAEKYPKLALGAIASRFNLTLADLQQVLREHGYPEPALMDRAAAELTARAANEVRYEELDHAGGDQADHTALITVHTADLRNDPNNIREELLDIDELADSIRENGLLQPIVARREGKQLIVVAGHRRLAAVRLLKWDEISVIVHDHMRPDTVLAAMLIENGQRVDLNPMEEARGLARLKAQLDCSDAELARRIGRSGAHVSNRLALLSLTAAEQAQVINGELRVTYASHRGRLNSGKVMAPGQLRDWHLGQTHDLANNAKARCTRLAHKNGRKVGGVACGECWESVIRADERRQLIDANNNDGTCATCGATA
jgi:ParB family transcriptional regulator, chromosome partitioning protein